MSRAAMLTADASEREMTRRATRTRQVIASGCLAGLALSPRLWFGPRVFPAAPVWSGLPEVPPIFALLLYGVMIGLLAMSLLPRARWALVGFLVLAGTWSLWDQVRWQPWFYQYLAMLVCLVCAERRDASDQPSRSNLNACRLIVAGTYIWSGLQKANVSFVEIVFPWLAQPFFLDRDDAKFAAAEGVRSWFTQSHFSGTMPDGIEYIAISIPLLEATMGLALLVPRLRTAAIAAVCVMHGLILLSIGPLGHAWNTVVWPWNITMPLATVTLFARSKDDTLLELLWGRWSWLHRGAALLFLLLPALSFWGWWDSYLSASLYSGNTLQGVLMLNDRARQQLPASAQELCEEIGDEKYQLKLFNWSMKDLNAPPYPARRVFRSIHRAICRRYADQPGDVTLAILERPTWRSTERKLTQHRCP